jgi:hypothetical protein
VVVMSFLENLKIKLWGLQWSAINNLIETHKEIGEGYDQN